MRELTPNQTFDPGRGSFLVRPQLKDKRLHIFVAPTTPKYDGSYETHSNTIEFRPIPERGK